MIIHYTLSLFINDAFNKYIEMWNQSYYNPSLNNGFNFQKPISYFFCQIWAFNNGPQLWKSLLFQFIKDVFFIWSTVKEPAVISLMFILTSARSEEPAVISLILNSAVSFTLREASAQLIAKACTVLHMNYSVCAVRVGEQLHSIANSR